jgi:hypothetical protein
VNRTISVLSPLLLGVILVSACQQEAEQAPASNAPTAAVVPQSTAPQPHVVDLIPAAPAIAPTSSAANGLVTGAVVETMDSGGYTYARVDVDGQPLWAAGPPTPLAVGDIITFSTLIPMQNFHSNTMNRDFPVLYFVDGYTTANAPAPGTSHSAMPTVAPAAPDVAAAVPLEGIEKVEGGYTIAEILAQRAELSGKPVKVRGKVTKVVSGIMGKNWVHISDSSGSDDFIVTTTGTAAVGQVIVAEGTISLDRDFGYGYKYDILMEDGAVTVE